MLAIIVDVISIIKPEINKSSKGKSLILIEVIIYFLKITLMFFYSRKIYKVIVNLNSWEFFLFYKKVM